MKKVISFIASNYRNDKIWLRRTMPSKRDYKILDKNGNNYETKLIETEKSIFFI